MDEEAGELAEAVKIDLNSVFSGVRFQKVTELGLAGAQPLDSVSHSPLSFSPPARLKCDKCGRRRHSYHKTQPTLLLQ